MKDKHVTKAVVLEQTPPIEPTPRELHLCEQIGRVTQIVEGFKFERREPDDDKHGEKQSDKITSIPLHGRVHLFARRGVNRKRPGQLLITTSVGYEASLDRRKTHVSVFARKSKSVGNG